MSRPRAAGRSWIAERICCGAARLPVRSVKPSWRRGDVLQEHCADLLHVGLYRVPMDGSFVSPTISTWIRGGASWAEAAEAGTAMASASSQGMAAVHCRPRIAAGRTKYSHFSRSEGDIGHRGVGGSGGSTFPLNAGLPGECCACCYTQGTRRHLAPRSPATGSGERKIGGGVVCSNKRDTPLGKPVASLTITDSATPHLIHTARRRWGPSGWRGARGSSRRTRPSPRQRRSPPARPWAKPPAARSSWRRSG